MSMMNNAARNRPWRPSVAVPVWGWLAAGAFVLSVSLGFVGFLLLEHPGWLALWMALLLGLGWAGWDVRLRQVGTLAEPKPLRPPPPRPVKDGPFVMMELPGGTFLMGSPETDEMSMEEERPQHPVTVSDFRIARMPVTNAQWQAVTGEERGRGEESKLPVMDINWEQALRFCIAASEREGYRPCYRKAGVWPFRRWVWDRSADGYRLPTEAEWEYACRAGTTTRWSFGDDPENLGEHAWFEANLDGRPHPVADKRPNPWGLYDMHGNVWEWCWDWYGPYTSRHDINPRGPQRGEYRVLRGGSFDNSPAGLRSARRVVVFPVDGSWLGGFRCVRVPARQH